MQDVTTIVSVEAVCKHNQTVHLQNIMTNTRLVTLKQNGLVWVRNCFIGFEQIVFWKWSLQLWSNQSSCKENRAKIIRLQQDSNPWPPRYRFDTPPTELWRLVGIRLRAWWNVLDHIYALQVENTSESDPRSHEATKAVAKKAQNNCEATKLYWIIQKVLSGRGATVTRHRTWVPPTRFP